MRTNVGNEPRGLTSVTRVEGKKLRALFGSPLILARSPANADRCSLLCYSFFFTAINKIQIISKVKMR